MVIGRLLEIWRYPVKTMSGEKLDGCAVGAAGLIGDRGWALRDDKAGEIRGGKKWPALMQCKARYREQPTENKIPHVDITLPDGSRIGSDDPFASSKLSELLGRGVSLWPLQPADNKAHYRRAKAGASVLGRLSRSRTFVKLFQNFLTYANLDKEVREGFSREPGEPLPDLSVFPAELFEFTSPPGTYFDAYPIHLITTSSLDAMARINPTSVWDVRRFRPNFLIDTGNGEKGLIEADWCGRLLRIGDLVLKCELPTPRCGMTTYAQKDLPKDPMVLRSIVKDAGQNLGIYATVVSSGRATLGDKAEEL